MTWTHDIPVVLAIAPTSRGFGYIVLEKSNVPLDWGVKGARVQKSRSCLSKAAELMENLRPTPSVLVVEDANHAQSRRAKRIKTLIEKIEELARRRGIAVMRCPRVEVLRVFGGEQSKDDIAEAVTMAVPALAPRLPPRRRLWESEHHSMAIFEAAALALTYFARSQAGLELANEGVGNNC